MIDRLAQELSVFTKKYLCSYSNLSTKGTKVEVWFVSPTTFAVHWAAENWKNNMFNNYCSRVGSTLCQVWSCGFLFKICKCWGWPALSLLQCLMIFKFISTLGSSWYQWSLLLVGRNPQPTIRHISEHLSFLHKNITSFLKEKAYQTKVCSSAHLTLDLGLTGR